MGERRATTYPGTISARQRVLRCRRLGLEQTLSMGAIALRPRARRRVHVAGKTSDAGRMGRLFAETPLVGRGPGEGEYARPCRGGTAARAASRLGEWGLPGRRRTAGRARRGIGLYAAPRGRMGHGGDRCAPRRPLGDRDGTRREATTDHPGLGGDRRLATGRRGPARAAVLPGAPASAPQPGGGRRRYRLPGGSALRLAADSRDRADRPLRGDQQRRGARRPGGGREQRRRGLHRSLRRGCAGRARRLRRPRGDRLRPAEACRAG